MRDSLPLRCLAEALLRLVAAQQEEDKAQAEYEGYSWGYFGREYIEATERAVDEFDQRFDEYLEEKFTQLVANNKIPDVLKKALEDGSLDKLIRAINKR